MKKNLNRSLDGLHLQVQIKEGESTYQIVMQNQVGSTYTQIIVFTCHIYTSKKVRAINTNNHTSKRWWLTFINNDSFYLEEDLQTIFHISSTTFT